MTPPRQRLPISIILNLILLRAVLSFPIPQHLHPTLPGISHRPSLTLFETSTHIHAMLKHPSLNSTTTARVTLSINPLTVSIDPLSSKSLSRRIPLQKTFTHVSIHAKAGMVELLLRKTVPDLEKAIKSCNAVVWNRSTCLEKLAKRVCLPVRLKLVLYTFPCDDTCVKSVLEDCQKANMLFEGAAILTQVIFGCVAGVMIISFGWGFASAIVSIPRELVAVVSWGKGVWERAKGEGVKLGLENLRIV